MYYEMQKPPEITENIRNYDSSSYIGIDPGREIIKKKKKRDPRITRVYRETDSVALCCYRTRRQRRSFECFIPVFKLFAF